MDVRGLVRGAAGTCQSRVKTLAESRLDDMRADSSACLGHPDGSCCSAGSGSGSV